MDYMVGRGHGEPGATPRFDGSAKAGVAGAVADIDSKALFGAAKVVLIRHGEDVYTLRITRSDKLILTK